VKNRAKLAKRVRTALEREVDQELISKGKDALKDFDESQALHVPGRKRESKLISIRLPMDMIRRLRAVAMQKGNLGYQQLIRLFLSEALLKEGLRRELDDLTSEVLMRASVSSASSCLQPAPAIGTGSRFGLGQNIEAPFTEGHVASIHQKEPVA